MYKSKEVQTVDFALLEGKLLYLREGGANRLSTLAELEHASVEGLSEEHRAVMAVGFIVELELTGLGEEEQEPPDPAAGRLLFERLERGEAAPTRWRFVKIRVDKFEPNMWDTVKNTIQAFACAPWRGALLRRVNELCYF
jgi:hypothetical protein